MLALIYFAKIRCTISILSNGDMIANVKTWKHKWKRYAKSTSRWLVHVNMH